MTSRSNNAGGARKAPPPGLLAAVHGLVDLLKGEVGFLASLCSCALCSCGGEPNERC